MYNFIIYVYEILSRDLPEAVFFVDRLPDLSTSITRVARISRSSRALLIKSMLQKQMCIV